MSKKAFSIITYYSSTNKKNLQISGHRIHYTVNRRVIGESIEYHSNLYQNKKDMVQGRGSILLDNRNIQI